MVGLPMDDIHHVRSSSETYSTDMEVESGRSSAVEDIFSEDEDVCARAINHLKSSLIGSNRQKHLVIEQGVVPRLINLLVEPHFSSDTKVSVAYTLGSIAKGEEYHQKVLVDSGIVPVLLNCVAHSESRLVEACLCVLKTVFQHANAPVEVLYADVAIVPLLIDLMLSPSRSNQISVASILTSACKCREHQDNLARHEVVRALSTLLSSPFSDVQLPALQCLAYLTYGNESVVNAVSNTYFKGQSVMEEIVHLLDRNHRSEMQLAAARCLTNLHRGGAYSDSDPVIVYKALPCLVRLTKKDELMDTRVLAAETLAHLIEVSAELQRVAAISNHLVQSMTAFLSSEPESPSFSCLSAPTFLVGGNCNGGAVSKQPSASKPSRRSQQTATISDMKRAAFHVFGALAANDEDIRKRIIETEHLMDSLVRSLDDPKLQLAAIGCLHSLSRSVQLLRTTFQDHPVWKPLMSMLSASPATAPIEPIVLASSTLCNLLLEFSPSKEYILDSGAIELLCQLTRRCEPALRLNGVWGLMNMAFQAEHRIKIQIITTLESDHIFELLSDSDINVVMKTLGLLRNLLSTKRDIDEIMSLYGKQVMQVVILILESDNSPDVKEQALCILSNIADGDSAKLFIMSNEDALRKITNYLMHHNTKLQTAAVCCVRNLTCAEDEGSLERQIRLREMGVFKILQQLNSTTDSALLEKVKDALKQFT